MSELSEDILSSNSIPDTPKYSPWVMLISLILLISGLLLTSFMLLFYAWQHKGDSSFNLRELAETMKPTKESSLAAPQPFIQEMVKELPSITRTPEKSGTVEHVKWPKLQLAGFGSSSDGSGGFAIINGEQVMEGGSIGKIMVLKITPHAVVLEYMGDKKTMTMGMED